MTAFVLETRSCSFLWNCNLYIYMFPEMLTSVAGIFCFIIDPLLKINWKLCTKIFSLKTGDCLDCKSHYT